MCVVCGRENPFGLKGRFFELEGGELLGVFHTLPEHQSYPGRLHGGIAAALLDETIGRAVNLGDRSSWGVTVDLSVRFRRPVPIDWEIRALGRITKETERLFTGTGEIVLDDGAVAVEATGKYLRLPIERIAEGNLDAEWFPDEDPLPDQAEI
ncbi:MAG: PaaI family thioesterase [Thermoleophilia bacterium]